MHLNGSRAKIKRGVRGGRGRGGSRKSNLCIIGPRNCQTIEMKRDREREKDLCPLCAFPATSRAQHVDKKLHNYGWPDKRSAQLDRKCCLYTQHRQGRGKGKGRAEGKWQRPKKPILTLHMPQAEACLSAAQLNCIT